MQKRNGKYEKVLLAVSALLAIALTGFSDHAQRERARRSGFQAYMVKPVDPAVVAQQIAELIQPR